MSSETLTSIILKSKRVSEVPGQISEAISTLENIMVKTNNKQYWTSLELWNQLYNHSNTKAWHSLLVAYYAQKLNYFHRGNIKGDDLFLAGLVHDIGQLNTPIEILGKVDKLNVSEYKKVKLHVLDGREILKSNKITNVTINDAVIAHHENWRGGGYPKGLKGNKIPYAGRLFKIADQFEALQGLRYYSLRKYIKEPFSLEESVFYIKDRMGTFFDPKFEGSFIKFGFWYSNFL